ncbi:MAG: AraC family transcriptional regulator [Pseudomonadota bacterium]
MNDTSQKPQVMRIDTSAMTTEQTIAMAHAYLGNEFRSSPLPGDPPKIGGGGNLWVLGNISAAEDFNINARLQRRCERSLADTVRCRVITSGRINGVAEGEVVSLRPGDVVIEASNISFSLDLEDFGCDVVGISSGEIGHERIGDLTYHIIPRENPEAALIAASMRAFINELETCDSAAGERLALLMRAVVERQLDSILPGTGNSSARARDDKKPMLQFIEENLSDPDLGVDHLVDAFATSRAVVYRAFEDESGIARYISRRRLERALSKLVFDEAEIPIGEVANSLGFTHQSYFAKLFKEYFGISPSRARAAFSFDSQEINQKRDGILMRELLNRSDHIPVAN